MFKKKILSFLLVTLFASYYAGTNFFYHTHEFAWGEVTHSHPYTSGTHSHSATAFQLISNFTTLLFIGNVTIFCLALLSVSKTLFFTVETWYATSLPINSNLLRAPPVLA